MLVDDSNEDWWKVTWQDGVRGDSDMYCSAFPSSPKYLPSSMAWPEQVQSQPLGLTVSSSFLYQFPLPTSWPFKARSHHQLGAGITRAQALALALSRN